MNELDAKVALDLLDTGVIKFGSFRLKLHDLHPDAPLSPFYIDLRLLRSFPDLIADVSQIYIGLLSTLECDLLADVPTAVTPIVAIVSQKTKIPMISPRLDKKTHGSIGEIDGRYFPSQKVVILDDVITRAESKIQVIEILEKAELIIKGIVVLIDRGQGGFDEIRKRGYTCYAAFRIEELFSFYRDLGKLNRVTFNTCIEYLRSQSMTKGLG